MNSLQHDHFTLLDSIGNLHLRRYSSESNDDQSVYIVIPSLHPGRVAYQGKLIELSKAVYLMTAMKGWVAFDEALKRTSSTSPKPVLCAQIVKAVEDKTGPGTKFYKRFQHLKQQYVQELQRKSNAIFLSSTIDKLAHITKVRNARDDLFAQLRQNNSQCQRRLSANERAATAARKIKWVVYSGPPGVAMASSFAVWAQAKKELDMLMACSFLYTIPNTPERRNEVARLYNKHVTKLLTPEAIAGNRDQFFDFATSLQVTWRGSYYLCATSTQEATRDLPNLIRCFLTEAIKNPYGTIHVRQNHEISRTAALLKLENWFARIFALTNCDNDAQFVEMVNKNWLEYMQERAPDVYRHLDNQAQKAACENQMYFTKDDLNGTEITICEYHRNHDSGAVSYSVSWRVSSGETFTIENLPLPKPVKPTKDSERRFIYFVPEGIVIADENGNPIDAHIVSQATRQAGMKKPPVYPTLPLALMILSLQSHPHGNAFLRLWEAQSGTAVDEVILRIGPASKNEQFISADYYTSGPTRALPLCHVYSGSAKLAVQNLLPVYPGDSLWLIHKFLEAIYPHGGLVKCSNPDKDRTGESVFSKLSKYVILSRLFFLLIII